jgi:hypothetical protein
MKNMHHHSSIINNNIANDLLNIMQLSLRLLTGLGRRKPENKFQKDVKKDMQMAAICGAGVNATTIIPNNVK